jgi:hypothetical protein
VRCAVETGFCGLVYENPIKIGLPAQVRMVILRRIELEVTGCRVSSREPKSATYKG